MGAFTSGQKQFLDFHRNAVSCNLSAVEQRLEDVHSGPDSVAKVPKGHAANFPPKNEISDNRRSMQPQTRCRNRLCVWRPTALSPTLLFDRRAYGSKNLSRMPQKDFCNTIALKADIHRKGRHVSKVPEAVVD